MKVELQISESYEEENWLSKHLKRPKSPKVIEFAENLDQKKNQRENRRSGLSSWNWQDSALLYRKSKGSSRNCISDIQRWFTALSGSWTLAKQFYPNFPVRNHQYRLHLSPQAHPQRSSWNFLEEWKLHLLFTPLPKTIKEKLELWKQIFHDAAAGVSSASSSLSSFHSFMHRVLMPHLALNL